MITFKDIQLEDKPIFDQFFSAKHYENSEFSFTNMFIWRMSYRFKYAVINDHLCVMGEYRGKYPFIFPPISLSDSDYQKVLPMLAEVFHSKGYPLVLKSVPEQQKTEIEAALPGRIVFREDRNNFDYVYLSRELIELKGKRFRQKRNHINKFLKYYDYQYEEMSESNLEECLKTQHQWLSQQGDAEDESILEEKQAVEEIINNFHQLKLTGGVIRINGRVRAFSLGELFNPDMAVIHIEKLILSMRCL